MLRRAMMRRGPGLLGAAATTAVVAGTASAVSGRVQHRQAQRWQEQAQPEQVEPAQAYAPPPAQAPPVQSSGITDESLAKLERLAELHAQGVLTADELATQKARILGL